MAQSTILRNRFGLITCMLAVGLVGLNAIPAIAGVSGHQQRVAITPQTILNQIEYATYPDEKRFHTRPVRASVSVNSIGYHNSCKEKRQGLFRFWIRNTAGFGYGTCGPLTSPLPDLEPQAAIQYRQLKPVLKKLGGKVLKSVGIGEFQLAKFIGGTPRLLKAYFNCPAKTGSRPMTVAAARIVLRKARSGSRASIKTCR